MACPDLQALSMYIDGELAPSATQGVASHLVTCRRCRQTVRWWESMRHGLHEVLRQSPAGPPTAIDKSCAQDAELSGYVAGVLSPEAQQVVEAHLQHCDACLAEVMALHRTRHLLAQERWLSPPESLVRRLRRAMGGENQQPANLPIARIAVQIARAGLKIAESWFPPTTAWQITRLQLPGAAFRGTSSGEAWGEGMEIFQMIGELEIRITLLREDDAAVLCRLAVRKQGRPLSQARVTLRKEGRTVYSRQLSPEGQVGFPRLSCGSYTINIPQEQAETTLILQDPMTIQS